jgi:hypothetical protein
MLVVMDRDDAEEMAADLLRCAVEKRRESGRELLMMGFLIIPDGDPSVTESFNTKILPCPLFTCETREVMRQCFSTMADIEHALAAVVIHESWAIDIPQDNPAEMRRLIALRRSGVPVQQLPGSYEAIVCILEHPFGVMMWTAKIGSHVGEAAVAEPTPKWICADDVVRMEGAMVNLSGLVKIGVGAAEGDELPSVGEA